MSRRGGATGPPTLRYICTGRGRHRPKTLWRTPAPADSAERWHDPRLRELVVLDCPACPLKLDVQWLVLEAFATALVMPGMCPADVSDPRVPEALRDFARGIVAAMLESEGLFSDVGALDRATRREVLRLLLRDRWE